MGVSGATAASAATAPTPAVSAAAPTIEQLQAEYRATASTQEYQAAVAAYDALVLPGEAASDGTVTVAPVFQICLSVPKAAVVAYAWYVIVGGGATAIVGGFLDATIIGLPAGAVLNAIGIGTGITGTALLYWTDHTSWPKKIACIG